MFLLSHFGYFDLKAFSSTTAFTLALLSLSLHPSTHNSEHLHTFCTTFTRMLFNSTYAEPIVPVLGVAALDLGTTMNRCPFIVTTDCLPEDGSFTPPPPPPLAAVALVLLSAVAVDSELSFVAGQQPLNIE